ncbi:MAG: hypothetical protein ACK4IY_02640 [Chitinophagales bacterium]
MNYILKISAVATMVVSLVACGADAKDKKGKTGELKAKLEKLKKEKSKLDADIRKLEDQIAKADPQAAKQVLKLVSVYTIRTQDFSHYIELQGNHKAISGYINATRGISTCISSSDVDTFYYSIQIRDRAGHWSNIIRTPDLYINCD